MKNILTFLLAVASCSVALGQNKNNIYVDVGINERGLAATYDRKLVKHFDIGLGVNTYYFGREREAKNRTAVYVDARPYWQFGKSMLFVFVDIGATYNSGSMPDSESLTPVTLYNTFGVGYHYRINKRGMGPYISVGMYGYYESIHYSRAIFRGTPAADYTIEEFFGVLSLGFKF